jgi:hypothetical protein
VAERNKARAGPLEEMTRAQLQRLVYNNKCDSERLDRARGMLEKIKAAEQKEKEEAMNKNQIERFARKPQKSTWTASEMPPADSPAKKRGKPLEAMSAAPNNAVKVYQWSELLGKSYFEPEPHLNYADKNGDNRKERRRKAREERRRGNIKRR